MITISSPLGPVQLCARGDELSIVHLVGELPPLSAPREERASDILLAAADQLREYFAGHRRTFDLPLAPQGTGFQQRVWEALCRIPYGITRSYGEVAAAIGRPSASRAVGAANGKNPIWIIVPCHRVIGASGHLTGYAGGLEAKRWLLAHEGAATLPLCQPGA
jgi:methylated-DNA-[protein]-cysteine S-methyltransferase